MVTIIPGQRFPSAAGAKQDIANALSAVGSSPALNSGPTPPLRTQLLTNLTTQTHLLSTLFTLLSSPSPTSLPPSSSSAPSPTIQGLYAQLVQATVELDGLVDQAYVHQEAYGTLMRLKGEAKGLEGEVRAALRTLEGGVGELEGMVREGRKVKESIERSEKDPLSSSTLLSVAQNLAAHSSAPLSALLAPQDRAQYMPWPTEGAMRAGILFMMGGSMSGVGDLGKIGDETAEASRMDIDPQGAQPQHQTVHEVDTRRFDPNAVFQLDLNSDSEEDD